MKLYGVDFPPSGPPRTSSLQKLTKIMIFASRGFEAGNTIYGVDFRPSGPPPTNPLQKLTKIVIFATRGGRFSPFGFMTNSFRPKASQNGDFLGQ